MSTYTQTCGKTEKDTGTYVGLEMESESVSHKEEIQLSKAELS